MSDVEQTKVGNDILPLPQAEVTVRDEEDSGSILDVTDNDNVEVNVEEVSTQRHYADHILRDRRQLKEPAKFLDYVFLTHDTPATYDEAMKCEDGAKWKAAMDAEMQSLIKSGTWQLVELPEGRKAIDNRWVMRVKHNPDGNIDCYKARLVAKGCSKRLE